MPYCGKCGTKFPDDFQFCPNCGAPSPTKHSSENVRPEDYGRTIQRSDFVYGVVSLENLPAGHVIDERYEIKRKIGQGGFGAVYLAFDRKMKVNKALKVIPEAVSSDLRAMANLRQEAQTMIRLNHPNIVRVYDFHEEGAVKYIDMEYVEGKSLSDALLDYPGQRMPEEEVKQIALQILDGVAYAHSQNVIHRDIKPQNIMIRRGDRPDCAKIKIMDFGIAETLRTSMSMIQNTSTTGTLVYMAPEQLRGQGVSKRSDIYSLGATLYELLNGKPPFYTGDITYQILHEDPKPLPHVSESMNKILLTCLQKDQSKRFQSCKAMKKAIETGNLELGTDGEQAGEKIKDERLKIKKAKGGVGKWIGIAAAVAVLLMVGLLGLKQGWFGGKNNSGTVTMEDMKDESWDKLTDLEKKRIETLLKEADQYYVTNRLMKPAGKNAYELYNEVLKIHPGNKYALAQLDLIKKDFLKRGELEYQRAKYDEAINIALSGLSYFEGDGQLKDLLNKSKLQKKIKQLEQKAQRAFDAKEYTLAINTYFLLNRLKPSSAYVQALQRARQAAEAERQKWLKYGIEWVWVEGGSFEMGCTSEQSGCWDNEKPVHTVTVDGFYMSKYEVTVAQFAAFIKATGYKTDAEKEGYSWIWDGGWKKKNAVNWRCDVKGNIRPKSEYNHPVIHVSWNDAVAFCKWLSQKTGTTIRLPTEAEWEYAARGGQKSRGYQYAGSNDVDAVAWYWNNSGKRTHPVGQKQPNELGLYDMSGNVWEWCLDWYDEGYYSHSPRNNPGGPSGGAGRVVRGGNWMDSAGDVRVAVRGLNPPSVSGYYLGFRLLMTR